MRDWGVGDGRGGERMERGVRCGFGEWKRGLRILVVWKEIRPC